MTAATGTRSALLVLGGTAGVAQAILLRESLAAFGGSELGWGAVMATWLLAVAAGARIGSAVADRWPGREALPAIVLATIAGVVLLRMAPAAVAGAPGELVSLATAAAWWAAAIAPPALLAGLTFPALVADRTAGPAHAYALESLGAAGGGLLLTAVLGPGSTVTAMLLTLALVVAFWLWPRQPVMAALLAAAIGGAAPVVSPWLANATWRWSGHPGELGGWAETRHQRLDWSAAPSHAIFADGRLVATWPDPYLVVPAVHLRMLLHPAPRRVLVVGGLLDGRLETILRHPVDELHVVAEDPALADHVLARIDPRLAAPLADPRVRRHRDLVATLAGLRDLDLVLLGDPGPATLHGYRSRTVEALRAARTALSPAGLIVVDLPVPDTYLGGAAGALLSDLAATLRAVFPHLASIPGEQTALVAGNPRADLTTDPTALAARWRATGIVDPAFDPAMLPMLLDPARAADLAGVLGGAADRPPSSRRRSPALLAATALELGRRGQPTAAAAILALARLPAWSGYAVAAVVTAGLLGTALLGGPRRAIPAFALGCVSMGSWVMLVAAWQATVGSAYSQIGALTGCLMAGLAAGAWWAGLSASPVTRLWLWLTAGAGLAVVVGAGAAFVLPRLTIPLLLAAVGLVTGAGFPGAAILLVPRGTPGLIAGRGFAADDAGAAVAAGLVGALLLPGFGLLPTGLILAAVALCAVPASLRPAG